MFIYLVKYSICKISTNLATFVYSVLYICRYTLSVSAGHVCFKNQTSTFSAKLNILSKGGITRPFVCLQSLQTDAYDHYSAIYSLLCDRLKRHKTLRIAQPSPRPIGYPMNPVQVTANRQARTGKLRRG